jgi:YD repeat-containing protein
LQWQIIPNRLALNAGLSLDVFKFAGYKQVTKPRDITTTTTYDPAGNVQSVTSTSTASYTDQEVVTNVFNFFSNATIPLGLTVNVTDKFTLDALTAFNVSAGVNLTNITSLLFTVKF